MRCDVWHPDQLANTSNMASILCNKSAFAGATKVQSAKRSVARTPLVVRAQQGNVDVVSQMYP